MIAAGLESIIALHSDRWDRRRLVVAGQALLAVALGALAVTRSPWGFTMALAVAGAASGVGCGAAQALLVTAAPSDVDRTMVRWTLFAAVGDVLAPLVTGGAMALGYSYRAAMLVVGLLVGAQSLALALVSHRSVVSDADDTGAEPLGKALASAVRSPRLWVWLFAAATCTLLDELVVALATLHLARNPATGAALAALIAVTFSVGAALGTVLTDRALRVGSRTVLLVSSLLCIVALGALVVAETPLAVGMALLAVGITCAPHHALAFARAYETMPRNPGTVQAVAQLFVVVDVAAPLVFGVIADSHGLRAAIACLVVQPVVIVVVSAFDRRP